MRNKGKIKEISRDFETGRVILTLELQDQTGREELQEIRAHDMLDIKIEKYRKRRTKDANALLWACIGKLATCHRVDKWEMYLQMLKQYGQYTYVCVKPSAVEALRSQWRETEIVGEIDINGQKAIQILCYFGSSSYDTREFSALLDGVIYEMKESGLETPQEEELRLAIEQREKQHERETKV